MKFKIVLLFFLFVFGIVNAQIANKSLVITEARITHGQINVYLELTNMGEVPIDLSQYKIGSLTPWNQFLVIDVFNDPFTPQDPTRAMMLPAVILQPGESWIITTAMDFGPRQYQKRIPGFEGFERPQNTGIYPLADALIHIAEPKGDQTDSITPHWQTFTELWEGNGCYFIEHDFSEIDSVTVDQVGGVLDDGGKNFSKAYDVAGVAGATGNSILVRKFSVKNGNPDFANARGVGLDDSEWMPIPEQEDHWRDMFWTLGNHGNYILDENTLESDIIDVNYADKILTIPWGIGRLDDIMHYMVKKPGIAWKYTLNNIRADSIYRSAKTGDKLTIYVLGNELQTATFDIKVKEPSADANFVLPISHENIASIRNNGPIVTNTQNGILDWPRVTKHDNGVDTISGFWHGLPNALRTDSLLKYLEKPINASWELIWVDGVARPDLKNGDKLKVTAQNGAVKEYFLKMQPYNPSHNAELLAITWPDIPEFYRGIYGWIGDTIPGFNRTIYNYRVQVPLDYEGIPALVAKTSDLNAKVEVKRAISLDGSEDQRTITFKVTAEDDSVINIYNIELIKEKESSKIQPNYATPFLSEYIFWEQWNNSMCEIVNPGNQPLDLSDYMFVMSGNNNPVNVIASLALTTDWLSRYDKYVPGYKWVGEQDWFVTPGLLEQDLSVNAIVQPGDVFCMGYIISDGTANIRNYKWNAYEQLDVQFAYDRKGSMRTYTNPWNEPSTGRPVGKWMNNNWYMFKILNDSVKSGLKPATDPKDFELIETLGMGDGTNWIIGGQTTEMSTTFIRKPQYYKGKPGFKESFGTTPDDSEWNAFNRPYWEQFTYWPWVALNIGNDLGQHFMYPQTHYISTVSSVVYKVSDGYSLNERIRGPRTGTSVSDFIGNINKANENQSLTVNSYADGNKLSLDANLSLNDTLIVLSADSLNTTKYIIEVSEEGLSSNAVLTSSKYEIIIEKQPKSATEIEEDGTGIIKGFEYGTSLRTVLANIEIPAGANLTVINGQGAYVPLNTLNFDTSYVNVTVKGDIYFDVLAENGVTKIVYQLQPNTSENDAFILSDVYVVSQKENLVNYIPRGTIAQTLISNVSPSLGATIKVVDKMGYERVGTLYEDDKIVVTSANGLVKRVYHLAMLRTEFILVPMHLAYILSNVYAVDQVLYQVSGVNGSETISSFLSKVAPVTGATAVIVDKDGIIKTGGDIDSGDMVQVTSVDGKIKVFYTFGPLTSASTIQSNNIELYPNPTSGVINVSGVKSGYRIQVYNSVGVSIRDINVQSSIERISLSNQPAGMYMFVISDNNKILGRFKAMKQ